MINKLEKLNLNCNVFSIYDYDGLSLQELLSVFYTKINEVIDKCNIYETMIQNGVEKEVALLLNEWLEDGTLGSILSGEVYKDLNDKITALENDKIRVNVESYKLESDGEDYALCINRAIKDNKRVFIPGGTHKIFTTIWLDQRTDILMDEYCVLERYKTTPGKMFDTVSTKDTVLYNGVQHVTIKGGKIKHDVAKIDVSLMTLFHAKDVLIEGVEFINTYGSHCIDIIGCMNVKINNCYFNGFVICDRDYVELIQIDVAYSNSTGYDTTLYPPTAPCYDGTISKNITISNNVGRGILNFVGTHTQILGSKCKNINIFNNDVTGVGKHGNHGNAVRLENYEDVNIYNNNFENFYMGVFGDIVTTIYDKHGNVIPFTGQPQIGNTNIIIKDNKLNVLNIDSGGHTIEFNHSNTAIEKGVCYHRNIIIKDNILDCESESSNIKIETTQGFIIKDNIFNGGTSPVYIDWAYVEELNGDVFNSDKIIGNRWSTKTYQLMIERLIQGFPTVWSQDITDTPGEQGVLSFTMLRNGEEIHRIDFGDTYIRSNKPGYTNIGTSAYPFKGIFLTNQKVELMNVLTESDKGYLTMIDNKIVLWDGLQFVDLNGNII